MTLLQAADQARRALQIFSAGLTDEQAMEIACVFDPWAPKKYYAAGEKVTYGTNSVGDPQLYNVNLEHVSQADWTPDIAKNLYTPIGLDDSGYPIWSSPSGAHDAYNVGDIVNYNGVLYKSTINGNIWSPDAYPAGWEEVK